MRRIITLAAGITLAVTVSAQTLSSNVKVPRPQAPGMEFSIENAINNLHISYSSKNVPI